MERKKQKQVQTLPSPDAPKLTSGTHFFYAPQLYRQVLLRRVLAMGILSVCLSVCHDPVVYQAQVR